MQWFKVLYSNNAVEFSVRAKFKKNHANVNKICLQDYQIPDQHSFDYAS